MEIDAYLFAARRMVQRMGIEEIFKIAEQSIAQKLRDRDKQEALIANLEPPKRIVDSCVNTILFAENSKQS